MFMSTEDKVDAILVEEIFESIRVYNWNALAKLQNKKPG